MLHPSDDLKAWIVMRHDFQRRAWEEIACTNAATAGDAFRFVVLEGRTQDVPPRLGEYRVLTLEDSVNFAVELNIKDLAPKAAA